MKTTLSLLALLIIASAAVAAPQPIPALPATITKPGEYYFVGNMYEPTPEWQTAITVNAPGPVVIDLRGFAFVGPEGYSSESVGLLIQSNDVTIENGAIEGFMDQVQAVLQTYPYEPITGIRLLNLYFTECGEYSISFEKVNSSVVRDCVFTFLSTGFSGDPGPLIIDGGSTTGNSYIHDKVLGSSFSSTTGIIAITGAPNGSYTVNIVPAK